MKRLDYNTYFNINASYIDNVIDNDLIDHIKNVLNNNNKQYVILDFKNEFIIFKKRCELKKYFNIPYDMILFFKFLIEYILITGLPIFSDCEEIACEAEFFAREVLQDIFKEDVIKDIVYTEVNIIGIMKNKIDATRKIYKIKEEILFPYSWSLSTLSNVNNILNQNETPISNFKLVCIK